MLEPFRNSGSMNGPTGGTSLTLLDRLRTNVPDAWQTLVSLYSPLVYQWCARAEVRGPDAEDVSQEVFRAVALHLPGFRRDREGDTFRGWLRVITRNMILVHFRRSNRQIKGIGGTDAFVKLSEVADPNIEVTWDTDDQSEGTSLRKRAMEMVRTEFEDRTWQMFWLTFVEERSPVEIAEKMGITPAAVRKAKSRVLFRLKQEFVGLIE